jgi:hypothetical protein
MKTRCAKLVWCAFGKLDLVRQSLRCGLEHGRSCQPAQFSLLVGPRQCRMLQPIPVRVTHPRQPSPWR